VQHYVWFKDDESYEDKEGTACNLHVTHRKCVQNSGQNFSREGLFEKPRYGSEDKIKIDLRERDEKCMDWIHLTQDMDK